MTDNDPAALTELQAIAGEAFAVLNTGDQISPFSARFSGFNLEDAYRVTAAIRQMREARGVHLEQGDEQHPRGVERVGDRVWRFCRCSSRISEG
jgi:hypothetical protein